MIFSYSKGNLNATGSFLKITKDLAENIVQCTFDNMNTLLQELLLLILSFSQ